MNLFVCVGSTEAQSLTTFFQKQWKSLHQFSFKHKQESPSSPPSSSTPSSPLSTADTNLSDDLNTDPKTDTDPDTTLEGPSTILPENKLSLSLGLPKASPSSLLKPHLLTTTVENASAKNTTEKDTNIPNSTNFKSLPETTTETDFQTGSATLDNSQKHRYQSTNLYVIRQATFQIESKEQKIDLKVPVLYRAGSLYLNPMRLVHFIALKRRIEAHIKECELLEKRGQELANEWDQLVKESTPTQALTTQ